MSAFVFCVKGLTEYSDFDIIAVICSYKNYFMPKKITKFDFLRQRRTK